MIKSRRYQKKRKNRSVRRRKITKGGGGYSLKRDNTPITVISSYEDLNNISVYKDNIKLYTIIFNNTNTQPINKLNNAYDDYSVENINEVSLSISFIPDKDYKKSMFSISNPIVNNFINAISNIYIKNTKEEIENYNKTIVNTDEKGNVINKDGTYSFDKNGVVKNINDSINDKPFNILTYSGIKYNKILEPTSKVTLTPSYFTIENDKGVKSYFCRRYHEYKKRTTSRSGPEGGYDQVFGIAKLYDDVFKERVLKYYNDLLLNKPLKYNTNNTF